MMKKFGIDTTRVAKSGPVVKESISRAINSLVTCKCGKKFAKSCPSAAACEIAVFSCPYCGAELR